MKMIRVAHKFQADGIIYSDPGHGWLAVKLDELERLGLMDKISGYSYQNNGTAYLEEDCDMSTYLQKLEDNGIAEFKYCHVYQANTPIRHYKGFNNSIQG